MKLLDFEPTDEQVQGWIHEHAISNSKEPLPTFIARKAAWHAADVELRASIHLLTTMKLYGAATHFETDRRPPPPKLVMHVGGYTYHLAPDQ